MNKLVASQIFISVAIKIDYNVFSAIPTYLKAA